MAKKSTTVKKKITNATMLELPQDIGGFTVNFRREAARSVGRIGADPERLKVFLELLGRFGQYAKDRHEQQIVVREKAVAAKAVALQEAADKALRDADRRIATKRAEVARMSAEIDQHDARMDALAQEGSDDREPKDV